MKIGDFLIMHEETDGNDELHWCIQEVGPDVAKARERFHEIKDHMVQSLQEWPESVGDQVIMVRIWKEESV